jgi:hypothetical protein
MPGLTFPVGQYNNTANRVRFSAYEYGNPEPISFVDLYTPLSFSLNDGAGYSDFQLGAITSQVDAAFESAKKAWEEGSGHLSENPGGRIGALMKSLGDSAASFGSAATSDTQSSLTLLADKFGHQRVKDLLAYKTRRVVNPNTHTLFTGVSIRKFSFSFSLSAKNATESETIKDIVNFFRKYLYPEVTENGMIFRFPVMWKVIFIYNNQTDNKFMPILHDCFLESFGSNHNPDANSWHADGSPVSTSFSLSFTESKTMHRESVLVRDYKDPA